MGQRAVEIGQLRPRSLGESVFGKKGTGMVDKPQRLKVTQADGIKLNIYTEQKVQTSWFRHNQRDDSDNSQHKR